jgi:hypothetical protein
MFQKVTWRPLALAACAWLLACEAGALTLGRPRGAVLIGRPLEVTIPVTVDPGDTGGPCASAELFHGENRVGRAPSVRWEPGPDTEGLLRVLSSVPVDEPVVTLYLRVGCGQSATRRFVLLPELPPDPEPQRPAAPVQPRATARPSPLRAAAPGPAADAPGALAAAAPTPARQPAPRAHRKEVAPPQGRLKLEPLDLGREREPTLRLSSELATQPNTDPQKRDALAAVWQAIRKDPDQAAREALRLQDVERELGSLRELTRQNAVAVQEMRLQVAHAHEGRRAASQLVLVLAGVLVAVAGWLAWRWHRARQLERVGRWFETHGQPIERATQPPADTAPAAEAMAPAPPIERPPVPALSTAPVPMPTAGPVSDWGGGYGFNPTTRGGALRMVGVEELIDVHEKADFFLSIGETGQAVAVLEAHVHGPVETGALAWMDLLELYHSLGRRPEYDRLRADFRERFTAEVPEFDRFDQAGAPLEDYPRALSRIVALWPSPRVLDVIDESIFRKPGLPGAEAFSLEAYRELVLLYHIAQEVAPAARVTQGGPEGVPTGFPPTSLQPLDALDWSEFAAGERDQLLIPPASKRVGVDIDLGELPPENLLDFDISVFGPAETRDS